MNPFLSELNRTTPIHLPFPWKDRSPPGTHVFPPSSVEYKYVPPSLICHVISQPRFWLRKKRSRSSPSSFGGAVLDSSQSRPPLVVRKTKKSLPSVPASQPISGVRKNMRSMKRRSGIWVSVQCRPPLSV